MIEVRHLTKTYNGVPAVNDLSFTVERGDVFGFIGPNGAGKTTTMRILATLLDPTDGEATVDGVSVVDEPEKVRLLLGYMPDYYGVYDGIRVWEYLDFFAASYDFRRNERRSVIDDVMALTDLTPLRDKLVATLSKGMKQRLCLAKTLIHDPKVLILDEPAAGLDPRARIELRELIKELARMGKTIMISIHILTELSDMCNAVGVIERGQLLTSGKIDEIHRQMQPVQLVTFQFHERADEALSLLHSHPHVLAARRENGSVIVEFDQTPEKIYELVKLVVQRDLPLIGLREEKRNLEDLFMKITEGTLA
jgi:ABC-2 type transport system ATP-binding protein